VAISEGFRNHGRNAICQTGIRWLIIAEAMGKDIAPQVWTAFDSAYQYQADMIVRRGTIRRTCLGRYVCDQHLSLEDPRMQRPRCAAGLAARITYKEVGVTFS
jgi:hypothetical protein